MPFPSARLVLLALIVILSPFVATASDGPVAIEIPADADILITDGRGVIVGAGAADGGATFRLALVEGFSGAATLIFVLDDGSFQEVEVTIDEGGVSIGERRLGDLVAGSFANVAIGRETPGSRPSGEASRPAAAGDHAPDAVPPVGSPPAGAPAERAATDAEDADEPAETELPSRERRPAEPATDERPADAPVADPPPDDEGPSGTPDDAPDRKRP